jgi:hypothetical protein
MVKIMEHIHLMALYNLNTLYLQLIGYNIGFSYRTTSGICLQNKMRSGSDQHNRNINPTRITHFNNDRFCTFYVR